MMDTLWIIISVLLMLIGIIGCILPVIPGPILSFLGLITMQFTSYSPFLIETLIIFGVLMIIVSVVDYITPIIGTKFTGGTKNGNLGAIIGLVAGFFIFPIIGLILGPFLGAIAGEIIGGKKFDEAVKIAFGSLLGILTGTFIKLALSLAMAISLGLKLWDIFTQ